ncbi:tripartite tricarboxylate transporter substrate binding protein [Salipaludibacillus sp. HK11]|uniref:tripartite tricarboxylate transporter substrate binding protein n=1 Tax=Salipaludibacillus sp. HK11 TaxID=3394320 RepID=UPI0039FBE2E8
MSKKLRLLVLVMVLSLAVMVGCAGNNNNEEAGDSANNNNMANENNENNENGETATDSNYPEQNIQLIVPYSAGGGGDTVARILADALSDELDQQITVVNRDGAGGEIGIAEMAASDPDGYTLGVFGYPDNLILEKTGNTDFTFDSFEYLAAFDDVAHALFIGPGSEFEDVEDVVEYAKENPGSLTIGESGALGLLKILAFESEAGIDVTPVSYDGGGELINGLLGDHIEVASSSITAADQVVGAGGKPLGYAASERIEMFSEYPTLNEQGYDLELGVARVLVAPEGLPEDVKEVLTTALDNLGNSEELQKSFEEAVLPYRYLDNESLTEYLNNSNSVLNPLIDDNMDDFTGGN